MLSCKVNSRVVDVWVDAIYPFLLPDGGARAGATSVRMTDRATFGSVGQLVGGWCPGTGEVRNVDEVYRFALKQGQAQSTLTLKLAGTATQRTAIGSGVRKAKPVLSMSVRSPGSPAWTLPKSS